MNNKKGTDKLLSIYWFVMLTLIAGGVFAMVYIFYGPPYDVREIESEILAERIADCISKQGTIESDFFIDKKFNPAISGSFTERCNFNFDVEKGYGNGDTEQIQYFYEVEFYAIKDLVTPSFSFNDGNSNWKGDCFIKKENKKEYARLAKCKEKRFYALSKDGNQYLIKILSVIGKSEKNVKQ